MDLIWPEESQRAAFGSYLAQLGSEREDLIVVTADTGSSTRAQDFGRLYPGRLIDVGIAEQNMMGVAAGLASAGKTVIATTFAAFAAGKVYDQIRQDFCYPKLNVTIVASHAGITVGGDGATHQIIEDLALMRVLPNMTVLVPCDANEVPKAIRAAIESPGPTYIRFGRSVVPTITEKDDPFEIGRANILRDGDDLTLIGTGIMVSRCLQAAAYLEKEGISARVVNMSTIKPMDTQLVRRCARETGAIVTAEEHNVAMGMGSAIALQVAEHHHVPMKRVGIPDTFGESGDWLELMEKYGLTVEKVIEASHDVLRRKT